MNMPETIFRLPPDLLSSLILDFPCRDAQISALATLIHPRIAPCSNVVVYGTEATGKTAIVTRLLETLTNDPDTEVNHAIVKSAECVTARHLYERAVGLVSDALQNDSRPSRCETLAALTVELSKLLEYKNHGDNWRFALVFDGIDRQRDAPPTLLPALARLSEIIPNLTTIFVLTTPSPSLLRLSSAPHVHFPAYTKSQYLIILSRSPPPASLPNTTQQETADLWTRFTAAVHDALARPAARTLPRLRHACTQLWPRFTAPVAAGTHKAREFSKLLIASRAYFQDESVLEPGILRATRPKAALGNGSGNVGNSGTQAAAADTNKKSNSRSAAAATSPTDLSNLLPPTARHLLVAAYLASHNAPRFDNTLFSTWYSSSSSSRRGRRGGIPISTSSVNKNATPRGRKPKHRRIARKLLGPGVFVLERMVAIYAATRREWVGDGGSSQRAAVGVVDGDVGMAIATLASLRLLVRVGGGGVAGGGAGDLDRGGKWRVNVGWEVIRGVGRSMGVEVEEWLIE